MNDETRINRVNRFLNTLNQARELGLAAREAGEGYLVMELPYSDKIIGNPDTGVIHGGAITTLMDTTSGSMMICALEEFELCPTLDLRVDYMRPAEPHKPVFARAKPTRSPRTSSSPAAKPTRKVAKPSPTAWAPSCASAKSRT